VIRLEKYKEVAAKVDKVLKPMSFITVLTSKRQEGVGNESLF